ncbi:helix-turn-helix domain-containing protein [Cohnella sp. CFH 77786]|uniref:helix-turn-helix domain-containing protein n=1 Tax=Cohnella sp. CFH 77786 TaxID=2662265 RepID=UPI001C60E3A4|nr:helix-turn-helix domain-containing protein [Cohnella sp. CFH 77786]MBW5448247.1 helix-turn-helix domain-containing protein [Cohnella sp. CFH 77786]
MKSHSHRRIITGHFRENDSYGIKRPEGMEDWLIVYTLEGEGYFRTPAGELSCGPGEIGLLRKGVPHAYGTRPGKIWHFMWAHFLGLPEAGLLPDEEVLICKMPPGALQRRVLHIFRTLIRDSRERGGYWQELCENQLSSILLLAAEQLTERLDPRVSQVMRMLSARMREPLTVNDLATAVGLSASRLSHLFKAETGRSVLDTLNAMRLEQASLLMVHAGRTATEAAYDVGFQNYNHFAALFRKRFGKSPSAYRRGKKKAADPMDPAAFR